MKVFTCSESSKKVLKWTENSIKDKKTPVFFFENFSRQDFSPVMENENGKHEANIIDITFERALSTTAHLYLSIRPAGGNSAIDSHDLMNFDTLVCEGNQEKCLP